MLTTTDVVALIAGMLQASDATATKEDETYVIWAHNLYDAAEREVTRRRRARQDEGVVSATVGRSATPDERLCYERGYADGARATLQALNNTEETTS